MRHKRIRHFFIISLFPLFHYNANAQKLVSLPFVGHTDRDEINIWCMFKKADAVFLRNSDGQQKIFVYDKKSCFRKYLPISCQFGNLNANQSYDIRYSFNNKDFFPLITAKTARDSLKDFSFLAGSCAFVPAGFNVAIKPFASLRIFQHMQHDTADFMVWLGDNLYYVLQRQQYKPQLKRNIKTRQKKKLSAFLHSKQQYAIWDDHDYGTNNSDGSFKYKSTSLNVFQQFWPNPKNDSFNYYSFQQEDAGFFMLDDRYYNQKEKEVLGQTQLNWLKKELLASTATFKFICIGMQALNPLSTKECLYKTEKEYKELLAFIREQHISGVLFLSGDRHHGELMRVQEEGLYPLYDFTTSPLTMYPVKINSKSREALNPDKIDGTYYPKYNYGKITLSGEKENRKCRMELKNKSGKTVWIYEIEAEKLK